MSPERAGSPQDETIVTPKMSVPASPVAGTPISEAQSAISFLLAVAQSHSKNGDDDLTNLAWLHERDLLKGMNINPSPSNSINSTPVKYSNTSLLSDQFPNSDYIDDSSISAADSSNSSINSPVSSSYHTNNNNNNSNNHVNNINNNGNNINNGQRNKHPHNIPYDPLVHTNNKPPYSFSCLIFMAIEDSTQKALPVKEIYAWILEHFPYFKNAPTGWKNSVRHNLSLNKCFQKVEKAPNLGKGSLWTVDQQYKPNLIQALTRSPFHPCSTLDPSIYFSNNNNNNNNHSHNNNNNNIITTEKNISSTRLPNPELYPYLSKKLAASAGLNNNVKIKTEALDESLRDAEVHAAEVMLSLKNGAPCSKLKREKGMLQVITTSPSQDHTYSAADNSDVLTGDEAFESDDDTYTKSRTCRKIDFEDEEERKIKEGAETLLNLAGISTRKRYNSQSNEYDPYKRIKLSPQYDINENEETDIKPTPFKPRLLRTKKKETKIVLLNHNNNNNNNSDEWMKHRRELEINQHR